jgi:NAD(P)-dependent dehydrogenase (short-subunit alcohol dehydrogenase family)
VQPWPGSTAYATSRWALRGLHEALRVDLVGTGVTSTHVIFGEVTSSYFDNNPGSHEHIPTVARLIPLSTPAQCADVLFKTAARSAPPAAVYSPFTLQLLLWAQAVAPWLIRAAVVKTGRRRPQLTPPPPPTTTTTTTTTQ